jgi:AraC family transcriptional regulator
MAEISTRRILTNREGRLEALIPTPPLRSSGESWQGITLEEHLGETEYVRTNFEVRSHLIHLFGNIPLQQEWHIDGRCERVQNLAGSLLIEPKGLSVKSVHVRRIRRDPQWIVELSPHEDEQSLNGRPFDPAPELNLRDPQATRLVQILQAEVENGCPGGSLFGEAVGNSLLIYLAQRYCSHSRVDEPSGGLPKLRLNRVIEYIESNLDRDMHLKELAMVAGLSAFHFAKLFKQSTGASPHQYVLHRRLDRAKDLLRKPEMGMAEISLLSGFADQSHFTNVFRRVQGITPSKFRSLL